MNPVFLIQKYNVLSTEDSLDIQKILIFHHNFRWLGNLHYSFARTGPPPFAFAFKSTRFLAMINSYIYFDRVQLKTVDRC